MSVYQVEEYYVHIDISGTTDKDMVCIRKLLEDNNWDASNIQKDDIIIEGFESEIDALCCDEILGEYLDA